MTKNVPRILPKHLAAELDARCWHVNPVFHWIQSEGRVTDADMLTTFNCGLGMVCIVDEKDATTVLDLIKSNGIPDASIIGKLERRSEKGVIVTNFELEENSIEKKKKKRVAVLISGSGTNLQALIDAQAEKEYQIVLVISNIPDVQGLQRAKSAGIETRVIRHVGKKRVEFDMEVSRLFASHV